MNKIKTPIITKTEGNKTILVLIAILSLLLYANTLSNGYVLDDEGLLINNSQTEKGVSALKGIFSSGYRSTLTFSDNELYRPVPKLLFALFWSISPANPFIPHLFNVLIFAFINVLLFYLFNKVFQLSYGLSVVSTILFVFHPVHTEVVANAKSLDELLSLLFLMIGTLTLNKLSDKKWFAKELWLGMACFLLALLSKESAIAFMLCVPIAIYMFRGVGWRKLLPVFAAIVLSSVTYMLLRLIALEPNVESIEKGVNYLTAISDPVTRTANALFIIAVYFKQMLLPFRLICDASFNYFGEVAFFDWRLLPILAGVGILVFAYLKRRGNFKVYIFGMLLFFIAILPVSNIFILIGTNYAERFLLVPSIGFCLFLAAAIFDVIKSKKNTSKSYFRNLKLGRNQIIVLTVIIFFYAVQTFKRNSEWHTGQTLFSADILKAPESARLHAYYANSLSDGFYLSNLKDPNLRQAKLLEAISSYEKAISINPEFHQAYISLAQLYATKGETDIADSLFKVAIRIKPENPYHLNSYGNFLLDLMRFDEAKHTYQRALLINDEYAEALCNVGSCLANQAKLILEQSNGNNAIPDSIDNPLVNEKLDSALLYFSSAKDADPTLADPWYYSYLVYSLKGNAQEADANSKAFERLKRIRDNRTRIMQKYRRI